MLERLQKIIAAAGITSRRKAEDLILHRRVTVNGRVVTELGSKADAERDHIKLDGKLLRRTSELVYVLLNKPPGYVSTVSDPQQRPTVMSLVRGIKQRVYPVGRLDFHSSGLVLLTNDGELANFLTSRQSKVPRTYQVKLEGQADPQDIKKLQEGIALDGQRTAPARIRVLTHVGRGASGNPAPGRSQGTTKPKPQLQTLKISRPWYEITLIEGRHHQVRRMFERIGQPVVKLRRVGIAFLTDRNLEPGQFRRLTAAEVTRLKSWKKDTF